ncbi:MAG: serine hydrolase [Alphaproteobacteria bacterium]
MKPRGILRKLFFAAALTGAMASQTAQAQTQRNDRADRYAAIVLDAETGKVLYERDANQRLHPASTTKMMTAYMVFKAIEEGKLTVDQELTVSSNAAGQPSTNLGMMPTTTTKRTVTGKDGKKRTVTNTVTRQTVHKITVDKALRGMLTHSANDAAVVFAEALGGTEAKFADMMNAEAKRLGMTHTNFENPNGLPDPRQMTTVEDMAKLSRALLQDFPQHYHYFSLRTVTFNGATWRNTNRMLTTYPGMDGIKTGWIRTSGFNLAASAVKGDDRVIGVVFGAASTEERNEDMRQLLDFGFLKLQDPKATYRYGPSTAPAGERYVTVPQLAPPVVVEAPVIPPPAEPVIITNSTLIPDSTEKPAAATPPEVTAQPGEGKGGGDAPLPAAGEKTAFLPSRRWNATTPPSV